MSGGLCSGGSLLLSSQRSRSSSLEASKFRIVVKKNSSWQIFERSTEIFESIAPNWVSCGGVSVVMTILCLHGSFGSASVKNHFQHKLVL